MLDRGFSTAYFWEVILETSKIYNLLIQYPNNTYFNGIFSRFFNSTLHLILQQPSIESSFLSYPDAACCPVKPPDAPLLNSTRKEKKDFSRKGTLIEKVPEYSCCYDYDRNAPGALRPQLFSCSKKSSISSLLFFFGLEVRTTSSFTSASFDCDFASFLPMSLSSVSFALFFDMIAAPQQEQLVPLLSPSTNPLAPTTPAASPPRPARRSGPYTRPLFAIPPNSRTPP
jgi:hypothetical protein